MFKQPLIAGLVLLGLVGAAIFAIVKFGAFGANVHTATNKTAVTHEQEDPLATIRDTLRKERDINGCKSALAQLNVYLDRTTERKFPALPPAARENLKSQLHLTDEEIKELARDDFSPLDSHYIDECLLFYDGIRSLKMKFDDDSEDGQRERTRIA